MAKVAHETGISILVIAKHAKDYHWQQRLRETERRDGRLAERAEKTEVAAVNMQQIDLANKLIQKAQSQLENFNPEKPSDILKALELGIKLKRQATGADEADADDLVSLIMQRLEKLQGTQPEPERIKTADAKVVDGVPLALPAPRAIEGEFKLDPTFMEDDIPEPDDADE